MSAKENYTYFWGGPFSNFHTVFFTDVEGISYSCTEQYYVAKKALFFNDTFRYTQIMRESDPKKQKKHGRGVVNFNEATWYGELSEENPAKKYMFEANYYKYTQNDKLKKLLLGTVGTELVEASPYDKIWGIGQRADEFGASHKRFWRGKNWLGEVLTKVRDTIIEEENKKFLF